MGKKKFIDKKNSATFHLLARDSSSPSSFAAVEDRVFVRIDENQYQFQDNDPDSVFADAPEDTYGEEDRPRGPVAQWLAAEKPAAGPLPEHIRREILELGLPDDGYNYLLHLREIKNAGGGAAYYQNSKAKLEPLPLDVKAYDASGLQIVTKSREEETESLVYAVASKTKGVKVQKAVDPDVARLLDDSDLSRFCSDVEDLEDDFLVIANLLEEEDDNEELKEEETEDEEEDGEVTGIEEEIELVEEGRTVGPEKPRGRRLLDEQFDLLTLREYDNDSDSDASQYNDSECKGGYKESALNNLAFQRKFRDTDDPTADHQESIKMTDLCASKEIITRCAEYAEGYLNESQDDEDSVLVEDSSDKSEALDCESILSTYSNLDNHPGKIEAPVNPRKRLPNSLTGATDAITDFIALRGKDKIPVEFLPHKTRIAGNIKKELCSVSSKPKQKPRGEESKEEKKERKAAIKEEKRAARKAKKELRGLYKGEAQRAQIVAASSGPSSIHLA